MRKKVGIIKRLFTLLLVFLLSINSFAAIVSDNDGSAFITKAEFDALKSSFQTQIDSYNQSIDSKIDGAIASYLAGFQLAKTVNFAPYFEVNTGSVYKTVAPKTGENNTKQLLNMVNHSFVYVAGAWTFNGLTPISWGDGSSQTRWGTYILTLSNYHQPQGVGWVIDATHQDTIIAKYDKDYVFSAISTQDRGNAALHGTIGSLHHIFFYELGVLDGELLSTPYNTKIECIGNTWKFGGDTAVDFSDDRQLPHYPTPDDTYYLNGWNHNTALYTTDKGCFGSSRFHSHIQELQDDTIYLYNEVSDQIYAYLDNANKLEEFTDNPRTGVYDVRKRGNNCLLLFSGSKYRPVIDGDWWESTAIENYFYTVFPKVKMKNEATLPSSMPDADGFNDLKYFKNGHLSFSVNGTRKTPYFYGGVTAFYPTNNTYRNKFYYQCATYFTILYRNY